MLQPLPQPSQQQQQQERTGQGGAGRVKSASRPLAEIRVRDKNMKMQLQLLSTCAKFDRDRFSWSRDNERNERDILADLAHMMDAKLSPSVDDWFGRRRIRQASCLPDPPRRRSKIRDPAAGSDVDQSDDDDADTALRLLDRQRMLEAKRCDWLGVTSVPLNIRPRPATAQSLAATAAVAAAVAAANAATVAALSGMPPPDALPPPSVDALLEADADGAEAATPAAAAMVSATAAPASPPLTLLPPIRSRTSIGVTASKSE